MNKYFVTRPGERTLVVVADDVRITPSGSAIFLDVESKVVAALYGWTLIERLKP
jgi:hypothetical protein